MCDKKSKFSVLNAFAQVKDMAFAIPLFVQGFYNPQTVPSAFTLMEIIPKRKRIQIEEKRKENFLVSYLLDE